MMSMKPGASVEDVTKELVHRATILWGQQRTEATRQSLEQTARQLLEIAHNLPDRDVEPSFYQYP
jgi:hypothetical protein